MRTIWKFDLEVTDVQKVEIPRVHELLSVQVQRGIPRLWALVDPDTITENVFIRTIGTGHNIDDLRVLNGMFLGTYQVRELVFHVFVER